jgi:hypothetical protein
MTATRWLPRLFIVLASALLAGCSADRGGPCVPGARGLLRSGCPEAAQDIVSFVAQAEERQERAAAEWGGAALPDAASALTRWSELCKAGRHGRFLEGSEQRVIVGPVGLALPGTGWCWRATILQSGAHVGVGDGGWMNRETLSDPANRTTEAALHSTWATILVGRTIREISLDDLDRAAQRGPPPARAGGSSSDVRLTQISPLPDQAPSSCRSFLFTGETTRGGNRYTVQLYSRVCLDPLDRRMLATLMFTGLLSSDAQTAARQSAELRDGAQSALNSIAFHDRF